jgi:hypothetical protein
MHSNLSFLFFYFHIIYMAVVYSSTTHKLCASRDIHAWATCYAQSNPTVHVSCSVYMLLCIMHVHGSLLLLVNLLDPTRFQVGHFFTVLSLLINKSKSTCYWPVVHVVLPVHTHAVPAAGAVGGARRLPGGDQGVARG